MKVFNTLTRQKEEFVPVHEGKVGMYSCGPTVYKPAHIGNLRAYVFMDELRRVLELNGYKVKSVMNITDVGHLVSDGDSGEDKMSKSATEQHKAPLVIAAEITAQFFTDLDRLNIKRPTISPCATNNIPEMIEIVKTLLDKGFAYETPDGIYFSVEKFAGYGKLSGVRLDDQKHGARVEVNLYKRHPIDFALWKKAEPNHIMQWDSPWGKGYPGWHIECTAMSRKFLGDLFDIHTGGVDHIPIHHENEIAQAESLLGHKAVNYWMHSEFMLIDGGKMSKSLGNDYTVQNLIDRGYAPIEFRYFCLNVHYRQKINFTFEGMDSAKTAYARLCEQLYAHKVSNVKTSEETLSKYKEEFLSSFNDDLSVPTALGVLWKMIKEPKSVDIYNLAVEMDSVFGLNLDKIAPPREDGEVPQEVITLVEERLLARQNKEWKKSDELRAQILALGYIVKDTAEGYSLSKVN